MLSESIDLLVKVVDELAVTSLKPPPFNVELDPRSILSKPSVTAAPEPAPSVKTNLVLPFGMVTLAPLP